MDPGIARIRNQIATAATANGFIGDNATLGSENERVTSVLGKIAAHESHSSQFYERAKEDR